MSKKERIKEIKIIGLNPNYEGCGKCKYAPLPENACKIMGCVHAWDCMRDYYTEEKENKNDKRRM